jgi:hypothetical protein
MRDRQSLLLVITGLIIGSCSPARPEKKLAGEAAHMCSISEKRICLHGVEGKPSGNYEVSLCSVGGERDSREIECLSRWSKARHFIFQDAPAARWRTATELKIAEDVAQFCRVPVPSISVEQQRSWWKADTLISATRSVGSEKDSCLKLWGEQRGYRYRYNIGAPRPETPE